MNKKPSYAALAKENVKLRRELKQALSDLKHYRLMDEEATTFVEIPIAMHTNFSGVPPYVGWKGLGLALTEYIAQAERDRNELSTLKMLQTKVKKAKY